MMRAVSRSSRLGKYRYIAEETIPISLAIARSDSPAAPSVASWLRAISVISLVISSRTRSRAVRLAFTPRILAEHRHEPRALLFGLPGRAPQAALYGTTGVSPPQAALYGTTGQSSPSWREFSGTAADITAVGGVRRIRFAVPRQSLDSPAWPPAPATAGASPVAGCLASKSAVPWLSARSPWRSPWVSRRRRVPPPARRS